MAKLTKETEEVLLQALAVAWAALVDGPTEEVILQAMADGEIDLEDVQRLADTCRRRLAILTRVH